MTDSLSKHATSCWNNVFSTEWDSFIWQHRLQSRDKLDGFIKVDAFHLISNAMIAGLNIDSDLVDKLKNNPENIHVISSYDTAGPLHFGNALVLRQLKAFHDMGCDVRIPMVDAEAVAVRGLSPKDAVDMAEQSMIPILRELGFDKADIYVRSKVEGIANYMAQLSVAVDKEEQENIYGHEMDFAKLYANLYMAADLLRPQLEGSSARILVVYGIDEAPHMNVVNGIAKRCGLQPVSGIFSPLIQGFVAGKKMAKSMTANGANIALSHMPVEAGLKLASYIVPDDPHACMIQSLRRFFLMRAAPEDQLCTLKCRECKIETVEKLTKALKDKPRLL